MSESRLNFKDPDELLNFLHELREMFGLSDDEPVDDAADGTDEESAAASATPTEDKGDESTSDKKSMFISIPEGSPFANQIVGNIKELYGQDVDITFAKNPIPPSTYDPERKVYFYNGEPYGEGAIIWFSIERNTYFHVEFEIDKVNAPNTVPLDIDKLSRHEPKLPLEFDYRAAFELAKTKDGPGIVVICRDGKFHVPCSSFYNANDDKTEYLVSVFNVKSCPSYSKDFWTILVIQVGNISDVLTFKFIKGTEIDWHAAVDYILDSSNAKTEEEKLELFDEFKDSLIKKEPPRLIIPKINSRPKSSSRAKPTTEAPASRKKPSQ